MAGAEFWFSVVQVGFLGCVLGVILNHFSPLFLRTWPVPKGSFGWPFVGETLGFLKPHSSNSLGSFLQDHCSR